MVQSLWSLTMLQEGKEDSCVARDVKNTWNLL